MPVARVARQYPDAFGIAAAIIVLTRVLPAALLPTRTHLPRQRILRQRKWREAMTWVLRGQILLQTPKRLRYTAGKAAAPLGSFLRRSLIR